MDRRSPLARVRGLGSAKEGVGHWWAQRLTALALIPLSLWFVISVVAHSGADHEAMRDWVGSPLVAGLLILLIVSTFYHVYLGLQVVIEDYVHSEIVKIASLIAIKGLAILLAVVALLSVMSILFGG